MTKKCPKCKAPKEKFKLIEETELNFVTEHVVGIAKDVTPEMKKDLDKIADEKKDWVETLERFYTLLEKLIGKVVQYKVDYIQNLVNLDME